MTKMCEAYLRAAMDPVTPMPVQFFAFSPVQTGCRPA